jgi:hypothetical protein
MTRTGSFATALAQTGALLPGALLSVLTCA